ncbi:MAG TPA: glycosyltransferase family 2 protein [Burkholderiales bacterium]|nr:glycosyltransferase family 2 protein [Burkholderiales bacterium]
MTSPLLTLAIPTWNRAGFLAANLAQIESELSGVAPGLVEVIVSDNCSPDETPEVVRDAAARGLPVRYVRNERNLGWALNFAQAFDLARGKYVLLLGDDDLFVDGALRLVVERLCAREYGVVIMRPFGFDEDFRAENPGGVGRERIFSDPNAFLIATSRCFTLTSACVINKALLGEVDSHLFSTSNLAAFHLMLRAALAGRENLYLDKYLMASKRQNSFSYDYSEVFVGELWNILDSHVQWGLRPETIRTIERDKLLSYYPFYLLDLRLSRRGDLRVTFDNFARRFRDRWLFRLWLAPTITLPRPLAIVWGGLTTCVGRVLGGDLRRGLKFALSRAARILGRRRQPLPQ